MTVFINEFHYDNAGSDVGEFIEIAGPAGTDLTGWSIVLYNGSSGAAYNTIALGGVLVDAGNGFGFTTVSAVGLQNGSPDGMALVDDNGAVVEFLSYEGVLTAVDGPASGLTSTDIGVTEPGTTEIGMSLQRTGTGTLSSDFLFAAASTATPGAVNNGQSFGEVAPVLPPLVITEFLADPDTTVALGDANGDGARDATQDEFVEIVNSGDADVDLSGMTLSDAIGARHVFADGTVLGAGLAIVVFGGGDPTGEFGGAQVVVASSGALGLNNGGDTIVLATADGDVVQEIAYGSEGGNNQSLTRPNDPEAAFVQHSTADGADGATFSPGTQADGTPFASPAPVTPTLVITEINADPASDLSGDANGDGERSATQDEFVEIVNNGSETVDLSFLTISDGFSVRHEFAGGTTLAAGAAIVVFGGGTPTGSFGGAQVVTASSGSLGLNNGGDTVTLASADEVIDTVTYGSEGGDNQSLTRPADNAASLAKHTEIEGSGGALFSPGTQPDGAAFSAQFVINEVDADQTGTDAAEFIEIYDGGVGGSSLDGLVLVLFNGNGDVSYNAIDLTGQVTNGEGFFVVGSESVANVDLVAFTTNGIQNGADAVALYEGTAGDWPDGTAATTVGLIDALVYGTSDGDDGGLLAALDQSTQYDENSGGAKDTDSNSRLPDGGDWVAQAPTPGASNGDVVEPPEPTALFIHDIQGSSAGVTQIGLDDRSTYEGQLVSISAVVTADYQSGIFGDPNNDLSGFFVQEEDSDWDADAFTSEGLFIFDDFASVAADVQAGDIVTVVGTVEERFGQTQLAASSVTVTGRIDAEFPVTATTVDLPAVGAIGDGNGGWVANLEAVEGMMITVPTEMTVTEMFNLDRFGEYRVSAEGRLIQYSQINDPDAEGFAAYQQEIAARSLVLDDGSTQQNPDTLGIIDGGDGVLTADDSFRMGDTLTNLTGVVRYGFNEFRLDDATGDYEAANPRPDTPEDIGGNFRVASLNVLNFFTTLDVQGATTDTGAEPRGADNQDEFDRQVAKTVNAIIGTGADILGLVELENSATDAAISFLVDAVNTALGGTVYDYVATGLVGGDAITNGLIYKVDTVSLVGDHQVLTEFEGRNFIDPLDAGRPLNRAALAQTFEATETGETLTIAVNHLKSKGSLSGIEADNDQGDGAGNNNATREAAADILGDWLNSDPTGQSAENQLILGDLNAYAMEDPLDALAADGFTDLAQDLLGADAYSYVFDGQIGTLDYALANETLSEKVAGITEWHINADEADAIDYNLDFGRDASLFDGESAARNSDHDPVIVSFNFEKILPQIIGTARNDALRGTEEAEEIIGLGGRLDRLFGGGGEDVFVFGEFGDGNRDMDIIFDFEVGVSSIELGSADYDVVAGRGRSVIRSNEDGDKIIVLGNFESADDLNISVNAVDDLLF